MSQQSLAQNSRHTHNPRHSGEGRNPEKKGNPVTDHLDLWSSVYVKKSASGRGSNGKINAYGIKKLRELILELAVGGKLVPQDPNNEPASVLLERIVEDKARLVKEGKIRNQKALPEIPLDEHPDSIPFGWEFVRLGKLATRIGSGSTPRGGKNAYVDSGIPFLRSQNIWNHGLQLEDVVFISEETHNKMANTVVLENDILLNITGASLGRCTIYPSGMGEANVSQHVTIIRPVISKTNEYLHISILSPYVQRLVWGRQVGMAREGLSKKVLELFEIPFPPLAEQNRIVSKVDELMALCDQLEQQQTDSLTAHQTLVETLLHTLTDASDVQSAQDAWARIADHFDTLFTTEHSIDQLKQTILQLAVMGKLVPQDPNDELASVLLEKIAREKERLVKEGKIKKQKVLPGIPSDQFVQDLPENWQWVYLGKLVKVMDAGWSPACPPYPSSSNDVWGVLKTTAVQVMRYLEIENKELPENKDPKPQYEVKPGDILLTRAGPKNRVAISCLVEATRPKLMISDKIIRFHLVDMGIYEKYISLCLNAGITAEYLENAKSGMAVSQMNISQDKLRLAPVPLCPVAEQTRIVAKVDELMTLCDTLKARLQGAQTTQTHLADAIVEQAVA